MTLTEFNQLENAAAARELFACCSSTAWVNELMKEFPFASEKRMVELATEIWYRRCSKQDWLESFAHHPRIGDLGRLREKFAGMEQASVAQASDDLIKAFAAANTAYEKKFSFIFIVCATGKPAIEMLRLLNDRISNSPEEELNIAMGEQHKISLIRFSKLLTSSTHQFIIMSQLTTHVLDTSIGKPGKNITVRLMQPAGNSWQTLAQGVTNADGRIGDLLPSGKIMDPGNYKLVFATGDYFSANSSKGFYPEVEIQFTVTDDSHYHVPLLINPFGYSTYRGS